MQETLLSSLLLPFHPFETFLIEHLLYTRCGTGPRNVRVKEMYSEREDSFQRSGQEYCKYKKDYIVVEFFSF